MVRYSHNASSWEAQDAVYLLQMGITVNSRGKGPRHSLGVGDLVGLKGGAELEEAESGSSGLILGSSATKHKHQGHRISCQNSELAMTQEVTRWEGTCS